MATFIALDGHTASDQVPMAPIHLEECTGAEVKSLGASMGAVKYLMKWKNFRHRYI
jgi:hypothetical protein